MVIGRVQTSLEMYGMILMKAEPGNYGAARIFEIRTKREKHIVANPIVGFGWQMISARDERKLLKRIFVMGG